MVLDLLLAVVRCYVVACQGEHDAPGAWWQAGKEEVTAVALGRWRSAAPIDVHQIPKSHSTAFMNQYYKEPKQLKLA